jgi:thymidylate kinase
MGPLASPTRPGRLIILVGPDGVGKTTVARALMQRHGGGAAYFHFLPPLYGPLADGPEPASFPPPAKASERGSSVIGWIRLFRNALRCWGGYLNTVRPALKRGWLVIGDRWMYGYLVQPAALRFHGPDFLARAIVRLLPRPHLVVNLSAPPHVVRERKQELTVAQIEHELMAWSTLTLPNIQTVDGARSPQVIAADILGRV